MTAAHYTLISLFFFIISLTGFGIYGSILSGCGFRSFREHIIAHIFVFAYFVVTFVVAFFIFLKGV